MSRPPEHPPGHKPDSYRMTYKCGNCKRSTVVIFTMGKPAPKKISNPCPNCGCSTLQKV